MREKLKACADKYLSAAEGRDRGGLRDAGHMGQRTLRVRNGL